MPIFMTAWIVSSDRASAYPARETVPGGGTVVRKALCEVGVKADIEMGKVDIMLLCGVSVWDTTPYQSACLHLSLVHGGVILRVDPA